MTPDSMKLTHKSRRSSMGNTRNSLRELIVHTEPPGDIRTVNSRMRNLMSKDPLIAGTPKHKRYSKDDLDVLSDVVREEMKWTSRIEVMLTSIKEECLQESLLHNYNCRYYNRVYNCLSIPCVIFPLILTTLEKTEMSADNPMIITVGLTIVAALNGLSSFINAGSQCKQHGATENLYSNLANEITITLAIPTPIAAWQLTYSLERARLKFESISDHAPDVYNITLRNNQTSE